MATQKQLLMRDNQEAKLDVKAEQSRILRQQTGIAVRDFETARDEYYQWLRDNGLEGNRYPLP
jgi:hypothetical protein